MTAERLAARLRECPLIVSVQASERSPVDHPETLTRLARASAQQGVKVLRLEGLKNTRAIRQAVKMPCIGLLKRRYPDSDVYITPTLQDVDTMLDLGCEIIALDGTARPRPHGQTLERLIAHIHHRKGLAMADCDTPASARGAAAAGADLIGTTLAGYTPDRAPTLGPDLELVRELVAARLGKPIVAEGRYSQRWQVEAALAMGAVAVVVGGAVNDPVKQTRALLPSPPPSGPIGAVDIGGTNLRFGVFDAALNPVGDPTATPNPGNKTKCLDWIRAQIEAASVQVCGVSTGGIVDPTTGEVWTAKEHLMPDHAGIVFSQETLGVPTFAYGDGHATAWGHAQRPEYAGLRVASLALGTGVGAGFVFQGRIWAGRRGEYPRINDLPTSAGATYEARLGGQNLTATPGEEQMTVARTCLREAVKAVRELYFPDVVLVAGSVGLSEWMRPTLAEIGVTPSPYGKWAGLTGAAALARYPGWRNEA
jgi:putative N-acetylmannosamine-6-phosphate epimerase